MIGIVSKAKARKFFVIGLLIILAGWLFTISVRAVDPATTLYIDPPLVGAKAVNDTFTVDVVVSDVTDFYGFQFDLNFNASVLEAVIVTPGDINSPSGFFNAGVINNTSGTITSVYGTLLAPAPALNGTAKLATVEFKVIGVGTSSIGLTNAILSDSSAQSIVFVSTDGAFDNLPPLAPVISTPADGALLNSTSIGVSGTAEANSTINVYEGATVKGTAIASGAGSWSTTVTLTEGAHSLTATATDAAGNTSASSTAVGVTVDTAPPSGTVSINSGDAYTTSTSVSLSLTYSDTTSGVDEVRYSNDGVWDTEIWEAPAATKSWTLTAGDGTKTVYYQIKDVAGNTTATSDTIVLDTAPPSVPTINPVTSPTNVTPQTITGEKSTDSVSVLVNGDAATITSSVTWSYSFALSEGTNLVNVTARDAAGNESGVASTSIILDTISPIAVSDLTSSDRTSTSITLSWTVPGDDGSTGTATEYDIRYSTSPIVTPADWTAAVQIVDEPIPVTAGSGITQSYTATGLNPETSYYFAIKARDEVSNWSSISNVLNAYTLIVADITKDGTVNIFDLVKVGIAFGSSPGDPNWDPEADLKNDGVINIFDLVIVGTNFGRSVPPLE